ncbi:MAG: SGNH/GDSL hydrolase family protein [Gammaproteobacteria bacterium]
MLFGVFCLFSVSVTNALPFSEMYVFGDSLSDNGNAFVLSGGGISTPPYNPIPSLPYPSGRFSDGPVAAELVAQELGLSLAPRALGGTNYALGGAETGPLSGPGLLSLLDQVSLFQADHPYGAPGDALYWIWGGGNDLRTGSAAAAVDAVSNLSNIVVDLYNSGARHFVVANAPDLGMTPEAMYGGVSTQATELSAFFNSQLDAALSHLAMNLAIDVMTLDVFGLMHQIAADPATYGITELTTPCLNFGVSDPAAAQCSNPDEYLFWDAIHPTSAAHRLVAEAVLHSVPEPSAFALMLAGLVALGWRFRTTRQ